MYQYLKIQYTTYKKKPTFRHHIPRSKRNQLTNIYFLDINLLKIREL